LGIRRNKPNQRDERGKLDGGCATTDPSGNIGQAALATAVILATSATPNL
jgi:hypothetical protein